MKTEAIFELDFVLDGKAAVSDIDDGIYVEGYASEFGLDRQDEIFEPGAFTDSMKAYMDSNPVLLYHHKFDNALGKVIEWSLDKKGMWIKAHLDQPEPNTFLADVFKKVKSGTIKGFSVGGKFHRRQSAGGVTRIHKADIMEISLTPLPVNSTTLATVCQKAFDDPADTKGLEERLLAVETELVDLEGKAVSAAKRKKSAEDKHTLPGTDKYPIDNVSDLKKAVKLVGNSSEPEAKVKAHIRAQAKRLNATNLIPDSWES